MGEGAGNGWRRVISRRQILWGAAGTVLLPGCARAQPRDQPQPGRALVLPNLPYQRIEVPGAAALAEWQRLKATGPNWPVVIGGDDAMSRIAEQLTSPERRPAADILRAAAGLRHPAGLQRVRAADNADMSPAEQREIETDMLGEWPRRAETIPALDVALDAWAERSELSQYPRRVLLLGLAAWTRLHGIMSLELGGHLPATGIDAGLLYANEIEAIRAEASARPV